MTNSYTVNIMTDYFHVECLKLDSWSRHSAIGLTLDPLNSVQNLKTYFYKLHFNTILLSISGSYLQIHLDNDILPSVTLSQNYRKELKKQLQVFRLPWHRIFFGLRTFQCCRVTPTFQTLQPAQITEPPHPLNTSVINLVTILLTLKMEAACSSESSESTYNVQHYIKDEHLNNIQCFF